MLRTLVYGIDLGCFRQAALKLSRSPSAVRTQLKTLEATLGTELLRKSGRGLILKDACEAFLVYARRLKCVCKRRLLLWQPKFTG